MRLYDFYAIVGWIVVNVSMFYAGWAFAGYVAKKMGWEK